MALSQMQQNLVRQVLQHRFEKEEVEESTGPDYQAVLESSDGTIARAVTETISAPAQVLGSGLSGVVLLEGESLNRNVYSRAALESAASVFAGKPIFVDHPTKEEQTQRPERSVRDLVGRLPERSGFFVSTLESGPNAGKAALQYRGAKLSETAAWLAIMIRENIAGDQSINAVAKGKDDGRGRFVVESFVDARSLDFVTTAAAGGVAVLESGKPGTAPAPSAESQIGLLQEDSMQMFDPAQIRTLMLLSRVREARRGQSMAKAQQVVLEALTDTRLNRDRYDSVKSAPEIEAAVRAFVEAEVNAESVEAEFGFGSAKGATPTIQLPKPVMELPPEGQLAWLQAFVDGISGGEEIALHKAWANLYDSGWKKTADGWEKTASSSAMSEPTLTEPVPATTPAPVTAPVLAAFVSDVVAKLLVQSPEPALSSAPQVSGLGVHTETATVVTESEKAESEKAESEKAESDLAAIFEAVLSPAESVIAARGR